MIEVLRKLSDVLAWQQGEEDTGILVRRAMVRWRLRHLRGQLRSLTV